MKKNKYFLKSTTSILLFIFLISSCFTAKISNDDISNRTGEIIKYDFLSSDLKKKSDSKIVLNKIINSEIRINKNYIDNSFFCTCFITASPYFYETDKLVLRADGFDIKKISLSESGNQQNLKYLYSGDTLTVFLNKKYSRYQTYKVYIEYNLNKISNNLFFFQNSAVADSVKEIKSWSFMPILFEQNEINFCDIYFTGKRDEKTILSGVLDVSLLNTDGTRTDRWKTGNLPADRNILIAGNYKNSKTYWRNVGIECFSEEKNLKIAEEYLKNTKKMIEFFFRKFKYDFPFSNFSQIVVKGLNFDSYTANNCVIYSDKVFENPLYADKIQFEILSVKNVCSQWFGSLICGKDKYSENLNDAISLIGVYLWLEHYYPKSESEKFFLNNLSNYMTMCKSLTESNTVEYQDEMSILRLFFLIKKIKDEIGNEAFLNVLQYYVSQNAGKFSDLNKLKIAIEEITGRNYDYIFSAYDKNFDFEKIIVEYSSHKHDSTYVKIRIPDNCNIRYLSEFEGVLYFHFKDRTEFKNILIKNNQTELSYLFENKLDSLTFKTEYEGVLLPEIIRK